jgi:spore coat protein U-like protein
MRTFLRWIAVLVVTLGAAGAHAAITCTSLSSAGYTTGYVSGTTTSSQLSFTMTCTRGSTTDPTSVSYSVKSDNGQHRTGQSNNAQLTQGGTNYQINYDFYPTGCAGGQWKNNTTISGTVSWAPGQTGNAIDTQFFWACINNAQNPSAAGAYLDTVTLTASYGSNGTVTGTVPVTIYAPANCTIAPAPSAISITYPAFSASAVTGTTGFGATCTASMPYTLDVAATSGTLAGINYNVGLSANSAVGTGAVQNFTVTVTAPAGQGGSCAVASCTATQTHTLTLTY